MSPSIKELNGGSRGGARGDRPPPPPTHTHLSQGLDDRAPPLSQGLVPALNVYHV